MPIDSTHPLYKANITRWTKCRDSFLGQDAIKAKGTLYLPKTDPSQSGDRYNAYLLRASYYEAFSRTIDGWVGSASRKDPIITLPDAMAEYVDDCTGDGVGVSELIKSLISETLITGRMGLLIDYDNELGRAVLTQWTAESILNWSDDSITLAETVYEPDPDDGFSLVGIDQIRQLHLVDGNYTVTLWRKKAGDNASQDWAVFNVIVPSKRGRPFKSIPFCWLSTQGRTSRISKPPLLSLANVALSHYCTSADLAAGQHYAGVPTLYITGTDNDDPVRVGAGEVIQMREAQAKVGWAEFTGQGLGSLEAALEAKQHLMSALGGVSAGNRKNVEAAETARIRTNQENSLLMSVVSAVEETLEAALTIAAEWSGITGEIDVALNREFVDVEMNPLTLQALLEGFTAGAIDIATILHNLSEAGMLPPNYDLEAEAVKLTAIAARKAAADNAATRGVPQNNPEGED